MSRVIRPIYYDRFCCCYICENSCRTVETVSFRPKHNTNVVSANNLFVLHFIGGFPTDIETQQKKASCSIKLYKNSLATHMR